MQVPFIVNGCAGEVPKSTLPAPEYERPKSTPWPEHPDAGAEEAGNQRYEAGPIESSTVGPASNSNDLLSIENSETLLVLVTP